MPTDTDWELAFERIDAGAMFVQLRDGGMAFMYDSKIGYRLPLHQSFWPRLVADLERGALKLVHEQGSTYRITR